MTYRMYVIVALVAILFGFLGGLIAAKVKEMIVKATIEETLHSLSDGFNDQEDESIDDIDK